MQDHNNLTPIHRWRESLLRWTNDTALGERFARWFGKTTGGFQLRWENLLPSSDIPWAPLKRPLSEATVALVSTAGVHLCSDLPFDLATDASFRLIPRSAGNQDLCITHEHYDRRDAAQDPNLVFPLERLLELEAEGVIGHVAEVHYGFGFVQDPRDLSATGREVGQLLKQAGVDLALFVPA
jgi:D-proline reductase (dithiol) PrdB